MAFVDIGVGTAMLYGAGIGAGAGALYSGVTGGNVLNGALMGAGIGALGGAGGAGLAGASWGGAAAESLAAADATAVGMGFSSAAEAISANPANAALLGLPEGTTAAQAAALGGSSSASAGFMGSSPNALQAAGAANTASNLGAAPVTSAGNAPVQSLPPLTPSSVAYDPMQASQEGYSLPSNGIGNLATNDPNSYGQGWSSAGFNGGVKASPSMFSGITNFVKEHPYLTAAGVGGGAYLLGSNGKSLTQPNYLPTYTPQSAASMGLGRTLSANYQPTRPMAAGGIASLNDGSLMQSGPDKIDFMNGGAYPMSQQVTPHYATPSQMPTSAQAAMASYEPNTNPLTGELTANMAVGGITAAGVTGLQGQPQAAQSQPVTMQYIQSLANQYGVSLPTKSAAKGGSMGGNYNLGSYSDGGRLLKGPGDGMSDNIPASIADKQPARLADGEFVVPADVVSHLGNGSTDAGAKHLYKMMDNVRKARTGRKAQGKQIKADKYLPK